MERVRAHAGGHAHVEALRRESALRDAGDEFMALDRDGDGTISREEYMTDAAAKEVAESSTPIDNEYPQLMFALTAMFVYFFWLLDLYEVETKHALQNGLLSGMGLDVSQVGTAKTTAAIWTVVLNFFHRQIPTLQTTLMRNSYGPRVRVNTAYAPVSNRSFFR